MSLQWVLVFSFCLVFQSDVMMQGKSSRQAVRRDLAVYDKAGPYIIDNEPPFKGDKYFGEIRSFLWEHWRERRLGLVKATFFSIEGDHTSSSFFVEPDAKGCWRIAVESESIISALLPKRRRPRRIVTNEDYDQVDRVEENENAATPIPLPENEVRLPQTFKLRLRNRHTNSVRIF